MRIRALDRSFDELYRHVGLLAAGAPHAGDAEEVGVGAAVALRVDQWIRLMREPQRPQKPVDRLVGALWLDEDRRERARSRRSSSRQKEIETSGVCSRSGSVRQRAAMRSRRRSKAACGPSANTTSSAGKIG